MPEGGKKDKYIRALQCKVFLIFKNVFGNFFISERMWFSLEGTCTAVNLLQEYR